MSLCRYSTKDNQTTEPSGNPCASLLSLPLFLEPTRQPPIIYPPIPLRTPTFPTHYATANLCATLNYPASPLSNTSLPINRPKITLQLPSLHPEISPHGTLPLLWLCYGSTLHSLSYPQSIKSVIHKKRILKSREGIDSRSACDNRELAWAFPNVRFPAFYKHDARFRTITGKARSGSVFTL